MIDKTDSDSNNQKRSVVSELKLNRLNFSQTKVLQIKLLSSD
jgi:hypothetical protein